MPRTLWEDPYAAQTIGLLQDPARARAHAVERVGEAQARAAEIAGNANASAQIQGGNAWAQGAQNIGSTIAALPGQIQQAQQLSRNAAMQQLQMGQMQRQATAAERLEETKQQLSSMIQNPDIYGEDGTINVKTLLSKMGGPLPNGDVGPTRAPDAATIYGLIDPINESLLKARASANTATQHRNDVVGRMASTILQFADQNPDSLLDNVKLGTGALVKAGVITPNQADEILGPMIENPESIPSILSHLKTIATPSKPIAGKPGDVFFDENTRQQIPGMTVPDKPDHAPQPTQASLAADLSSPDATVRARAKTALDALKPPKTETPDTRSIDVQAADALSKGDTVRYQQLIKAKRDLDTSPAPERAGIWIVRNGETLRVRESDIKPGDKPASTREQGRPVTSADAGRFAELQTSLDDIVTLSKVLGTDKKADSVDANGKRTGAGSRAGSSLWNIVTEYAGWGETAKERQAVIDRVRQVIGKALEGGVLRKEDEAKYEKILPTIGDPPALAKSKLDGLQAAIQQRLSREIDAREDAGYDVTKFRSRQETPAKTLRYNPATGKVE